MLHKPTAVTVFALQPEGCEGLRNILFRQCHSLNSLEVLNMHFVKHFHPSKQFYVPYVVPNGVCVCVCVCLN